jgi:SET domain-containing protein
MPFQQSDAIMIKQIKGKGRGVFARRAILKGEVIESVPLLLMTDDEYAEGVANSPLKDYCFRWGTDKVALALGYGSIYNHSYRPNARYDDVGRHTKAFVAIKAIAAGEEITINYNGHPRSKAKVWFDVVEAPTKTSRTVRDEPI